ILLCMSIACFVLSCSKNNDNNPPATHSVEYRVLNANKTITQLEYNDSTGNSVHGDLSTQTNALWSKTIGAPSHFHAELKVDFNNTTNATVNYTLVILFDGVVKDSQTGQVPAQGMSQGAVDFESE
ncbi:MAG TPA: hypothetical protein VFE04_01615, partial [Puia sp.]|nr:hypothetical protein [Puia sp.]